MRIHLEGMGLVGSLMALHLADAGIDFTWSDAGRSVCAWRASTGCCLPTGDAEDMASYRRVAALMDHRMLRRFTTAAAYGYAAPVAPHFYTPPPIRTRVGAVSLLDMPSYHLDAHRFVVAMRLRHTRRHQPATAKDIVVKAHGYHGATPTRLVWGWHAKVRLRVSDALAKACGGLPLALNLHHPRYGDWFAWPVPDTGQHYVGSSMIPQADARHVDAAPRFAQVCAHLRDVAGQDVRIEDKRPDFVEGWRPQAVDEGPLAWRQGRTVYLRPQHGAGWRHHPALLDALRELHWASAGAHQRPSA